jgi:XTP/dITP diphosphohydrolase
MFVVITGNEKKIEEFNIVLGEKEVKFEIMKVSYPELRSDDPCEISKIAAKGLCEKLNKTVVVEDSGLFIDSLNGYPGTCTRYIYDRVGLKGILKLMKGVRNRKAHYRSAIGYCEPGKKPECFLGQEEGKLAEKEKGKGGWGHDPIFIPKGSKKTYAELKNPGDVNLFRRRSILKLADFLANRQR